MDHYYVYYLTTENGAKADGSPNYDDKPHYVYDTTCGDQGSADRRVTDLLARKPPHIKQVLWLLNHTIKGAFH